jgi:hypothetical protein
VPISKQNKTSLTTGEIIMRNAIEFVSVEESALETVAGGLLDVGNFSALHNCINVASGISAHTCVGDVLSVIGNVLNEVH